MRILYSWPAISRLLVIVGMLSFASLHAQQSVDASQSTTVPSASPNSSPGYGLFATNCAACHGADGRGGERATDIATVSEVQQLSNGELIGIVRNGISGTGMPAFGSLEPQKVKVLVDYLRFLQGKGAVVQLPGDVHAGELLFFGKAQCSTCHMVNGKGGFIASDLSLYGSHETADQIRGVITDPKNKLPARSNATTVVTRSGKKVTGIVKSNDNFSIALQTLDGSFQLFQKFDLKQIDMESRSLMPVNYGSLFNSNELNDLISYLLSVGTKNASHVAKKHPRSDDDDDDLKSN